MHRLTWLFLSKSMAYLSFSLVLLNTQLQSDESNTPFTPISADWNPNNSCSYSKISRPITVRVFDKLNRDIFIYFDCTDLMKPIQVWMFPPSGDDCITIQLSRPIINFFLNKSRIRMLLTHNATQLNKSGCMFVVEMRLAFSPSCIFRNRKYLTRSVTGQNPFFFCFVAPLV